MKLDLEQLKQKVIDSQIWRSMFRGGVWKDTPRDRAQAHPRQRLAALHPSRIASMPEMDLQPSAWAACPSSVS